MKARGLVLSLALVIGLLGAPAHAAGQQVLVLRGSRTATVDITLMEATTFDLGHMNVGGSGRYAGIYAENLDRPVDQRDQKGLRMGAVSLRDFHGPGEPGYVMGLPYQDNQQSLVRGRYRIYFIADGPATVRVPITGSSSFDLRPVHPTYAGAAVTPNALLNQFEARSQKDLNVVGRALTFSAITVGRFRAYAGQIGACMELPGKQCGSSTRGVDGYYTGAMVNPVGDFQFTFIVTYEPGVLPPRQYVADGEALNVTTIQYASTAAFTLTLTG